MKVRENICVRFLEIAYPRAAVNAIHQITMTALRNDVFIQSMRSGPLVLKGRAFPDVCQSTMMVQEDQADRLLKEWKDAAAPFELPLDSYKRWGRKL